MLKYHATTMNLHVMFNFWLSFVFICFRFSLFKKMFIVVDSKNLRESIERAEFSLQVELWFGEQTPGSVLALASTRTLQLNFHPVRGLHYHLPVLFDYFHMSAVSLTIHASLVALHRPHTK